MIINSNIRNVCKKLQTGKTPPTTEKKYFNGNINWYTPGDLTLRLLSNSKRKITTLAFNKKKAIIYPNGTVLLSCIGDIGKVGITTNTTSSSNQQITGLIPDSSKIDAEYLYYWCLKHKSLLESKAKSAVVPILNNKRLGDIPISYEKDLEEQQKIASFLTRIEALIKKREESIQLLDELIKSTFLELFGDPVLNPKGWRKDVLENILLKIESGKSPKCDTRSARPHEYGVLKLSSITGCLYKQDENKFLNMPVNSHLVFEIKQGNVLFSRKNTYSLIAACAYVFKTRSKLLMSDLIFRLIIKDQNNFDSIFLWQLLISNSQRKEIQALAGGAAGSMPNISKANLNKALVIIPPKPLQDKFASIVTKIETTKEKYQTSLEELNNLFNSTAQKAFKGELNLGKIAVTEKEISKEEAQMLDEDTILALIKSGSFEAKDHVNEQQSYDDIRDKVLKLMDEGKITQKFAADKKMVLEAVNAR